jgi:type II secretory ATPase GspE/PulE/Tfp pilus assembly ATPase PilB-like protein
LKTPTNTIQSSMPLGEMLIAQGRITRAELDAALSYRLERGIKLGQALVALNLATEAEVASSLRAQGKVHWIRLTPGIISRDIARMLGEERARSLQAIAINKIAGVVTVAMEDPSEGYNVDAISVQLDAPILAVYAEPAQIERCLDFVFADAPEEPVAGTDAPHGSDGPDPGVVCAEARAEEAGEDAPILERIVIQKTRELLREALARGASDIHIEPRADALHVRLRIDGTLVDGGMAPQSWARPVLEHLKAMADLDVAERRLPQNGCARIEIHGRRVDLRIRTAPTLSGEGAVIRMLDPARERSELTSLALGAEHERNLREMAAARGGILLVTGPVGAGKTTTLYALLQHLHSPGKKIVTIEDPVEVALDSATQISINARIGLTFARSLRCVAQQDADVVLVGEMRDEETAEIALETALAGRLVLSTLHTAGAVESIARLVDMGLRPYLVADTLLGCAAQRLVRRLCPSCRRPAAVRSDLLECLDLSSAETFFEGAGCESCSGTGYAGRVALFEVLRMNAAVAQLVREGKCVGEMRAAARRGGFSTLRDDGIQKARAGETTLEEVYAATARI